MAKMARTKNAYRNVVFGSIYRIHVLFFPFLMRTALIHLLGIEYAGLSSLFTSILQVLNLAELGIGSAMVYSMYKPIAEDDVSKICAMMKLYRLYYRIIGVVIAVLGITIIPFLTKLVKGNVPDDISVYVLYVLELGTTVFSYWLFAYKNALLSAYQRIDVNSKIALIMKTIQYVTQLVVLFLFKNYYYYLIVALFNTVTTNLVTALIVNRMFPNYKPVGELEKTEIVLINERFRDLSFAKIGTVLGRSVDSIVISAFIGLSALALYQNYYYIVNAVSGFAVIMINSVRAGIGNSLITESAEKNYQDFRKLSFTIMWFTTVCIACFLTLYQPFMRLWVGQQFLLPYHMVVLFCVYFFLIVVQDLSCAYKDAAGIWHEDRLRPLIAGVLNLFLNVLLVHHFGLPGILLSTIISYLVVAIPWLVANLFRLVFRRSPKEFVFQLLQSFFFAAVIGMGCYEVCAIIRLDGILEVAVKLIISLCLSNILLLLVHYRDPLLHAMLAVGKRMILRRHTSGSTY